MVSNVAHLLLLSFAELDEARMIGESSCFDFLARLRDKCDLLGNLDGISRVDPIDVVSMPYWCILSCFLHCHDLVMIRCDMRWLIQFGL